MKTSDKKIEWGAVICVSIITAIFVGGFGALLFNKGIECLVGSFIGVFITILILELIDNKIIE